MAYLCTLVNIFLFSFTFVSKLPTKFMRNGVSELNVITIMSPNWDNDIVEAQSNTILIKNN